MVGGLIASGWRRTECLQCFDLFGQLETFCLDETFLSHDKEPSLDFWESEHFQMGDIYMVRFALEANL